MYIVEWDDHEGNRQERAFDSLEDAQLEASSLRKLFDYVVVKSAAEN